MKKIPNIITNLLILFFSNLLAVSCGQDYEEVRRPINISGLSFGGDVKTVKYGPIPYFQLRDYANFGYEKVDTKTLVIEPDHDHISVWINNESTGNKSVFHVVFIETRIIEHDYSYRWSEEYVMIEDVPDYDWLGLEKSDGKLIAVFWVPKTDE